VVLQNRTPGVELTDLSARALGVVGGVRPDEGMSGESDAVRLEATWGDFVANVSHELKTPGGAVALLAEGGAARCRQPRRGRTALEQARHRLYVHLADPRASRRFTTLVAYAINTRVRATVAMTLC
jgi:signal transduction histidine kinase